jgi:hypothetical protein
MSRPKGAINRISREKHLQAQQLVEEYGDPVADILKRRNELIDERSKVLALRDELQAAPSRHRRIKKIAQLDATIDKLDDKILRHNAESANYVRAKYQSINQTTQVQLASVIRAPVSEPSTEAWLGKYQPPQVKDVSPPKPKLIEAEPTMQTFVPNLKAALHVADQVGVNSAQTIVDEARRYAKSDAMAELDRKFLEAYK